MFQISLLSLSCFPLCVSFRTSEFFPEQLTELQKNIEALPGETVTLMTELPESGMDVTWFKDNVPLSLCHEKYETINQDTSYQLLIPHVLVEDGGEYKIQGGGHEYTVLVTVNGQ